LIEGLVKLGVVGLFVVVVVVGVGVGVVVGVTRFEEVMLMVEDLGVELDLLDIE
jgi:hypothetical protein